MESIRRTRFVCEIVAPLGVSFVATTDLARAFLGTSALLAGLGVRALVREALAAVLRRLRSVDIEGGTAARVLVDFLGAMESLAVRKGER